MRQRPPEAVELPDDEGVPRAEAIERQREPGAVRRGAALAEFERDVIRERTRAGLAAARARGRRGGRPKAAALSDARKVALAQALYADKAHSIAEICRTLGVSRSTLYRYITAGREPPADRRT